MENRDFYRSILDNSPFAYAYYRLICSPTGEPIDYEFLEVNPAFEELTGLNREQIIGKTLKQLFPDHEQNKFDWVGFYAEVALKGQNKTFKQYSGLLKRWYKGFAYCPKKGYFVTQFSDISEEKQKEDNLKKRLMYEQLLYSISSLAVSLEDLGRFQEKCLELMGKTLKVSRVYIFEHNHKKDTMDNTYEWVAPGIKAEKDGLQGISANDVAWWMKRLKANLVINYQDIEQIPDQETREILRNQGIKSILVVPLFRGKKYYGFIGFDQHIEQRAWPQEDVNLLISIAGIISQAIFRKKTEEYLQVEQAQLLSLFDSISEAIYVADLENYEIIFANKTLKEAFGDDVIGKTCYRVLQGKESPCQFCTNRIIKRMNYQPYQWETTNPITGRHSKVVDRMIRWYDGRDVRFELAIDITELKQAEEELFSEKERLRVTLHSIGDGVISTDEEGRVVMLNKVAEELTGWNQSEARGKPLTAVLNIINGQTGQPCEDPVATVLKTGKTVGLADHTILISKDGTERIIADKAAPIKDPGGNLLGAVLVFRDVTEEKKREEEIFYFGYHDKLTGLYNRAFFEEELRRLDTERQLPISLIMGDVNELKIINDVFGHDEGDRLLQTIAQILRESCRSEDLIARWGGDEFVILLPQTPGRVAAEICERIRKVSHSYSNCKEHENICLSISLGQATKEKSSEDLREVLQKAENLMYKRKLFEGKSLRSSIISSMKEILYKKSHETEEHGCRLARLCKRIGHVLGLTRKELEELQLLAMFHDIGKIALKDGILTKEGVLTEDEWIEIKRHPEIGYRIAQSAPEFSQIAEYILSHHERWDGKGYPQGLKGEEIPLPARILAVADSYDAMTRDRSYRKALPIDQVKKELIKSAGSQLDPRIVRIFLQKVLRANGGLEEGFSSRKQEG
jgi:diguanylate cyclase (GGDEF)-like protein/PAS domain S-box-containing protein